MPFEVFSAVPVPVRRPRTSLPTSTVTPKPALAPKVALTPWYEQNPLPSGWQTIIPPPPTPPPPPPPPVESCALPPGVSAPRTLVDVIQMVQSGQMPASCFRTMVDDWLMRHPVMSGQLLEFFKMLPLELQVAIVFWYQSQYELITNRGTQ